MANAFSAAMVPRVRDHLVDYYDDGRGLEAMFGSTQADVFLPMTLRDDEPRQLTVSEYVRNVMRWLKVAELFYVTPSMTAVAKQAAEDLPPYRLNREDIPAQVGFVLYGDSVAQAPPEDLAAKHVRVCAALWAPCLTEIGPGVQIVSFSDVDELFKGEDYQAQPPELLAQMRSDMGPICYHDEAPVPFGESKTTKIRNTALAAVMSTWLLMGQRISKVETEQLPRQLRRQYERAGKPEPLVRSVTLRRATNASRPDADGQGPTREYHHTWIVSGHWRNAWYPSREEHKPIYIASYVKGPEGAPLIGGERVNVLRR